METSKTERFKEMLEEDSRQRVILEQFLVDTPGELEEKLDRREESYNRGKRWYEAAFDRDMERLVLMGYARPGAPQVSLLPDVAPGTYNPGPDLTTRYQPDREEIPELWAAAGQQLADEDFGNWYNVYKVPYVRVSFGGGKKKSIWDSLKGLVGR